MYYKDSVNNFRAKVRVPVGNSTQWYMFNEDGTVEAIEPRSATSHSAQAVLLLYSTNPPSSDVDAPDHYKAMFKLTNALNRPVERSPVQSGSGATGVPNPVQQFPSNLSHALASLSEHNAPRQQRTQSPHTPSFSQMLGGLSSPSRQEPSSAFFFPNPSNPQPSTFQPLQPLQATK